MRAMGLGVLLGVASAGHAACGAPRVFWDAVLLRSWSVVVSCEHGERPAVFTSGGAAGTTILYSNGQIDGRGIFGGDDAVYGLGFAGSGIEV